MIVGLDHVQLSMPAGAEDAARAFYGGVLGLVESAKPEPLAGRGGCWFTGGGVAIHLGVEDPFRPARRAHPALLVIDVAALRTRLEAAGVRTCDDDVDIGVDRFYAEDPFGNRLEFLCKSDW